MDKNNKILIMGCGDIGRRLAGLYVDNSVLGIVTSQASVAKCALQSIDTFIVDLDSQKASDSKNKAFRAEGADLFYFVPPPAIGYEDTRLKYFLKNLKGKPRRIVMISTTGVYGDSKGEWIDEETSVNPKAERAIRRVSAENILQQWACENADKSAVEFMILRVPGIYAEDRLPIERIKSGLPIVNANEAGFTNRIHADDLASACKAAMACETHNQIINITDGNPSTMTDYFNHVADFANLPRPPQVSMKEAETLMSAGMISYLKESRRIRNDKMLALLNVQLRYPTLNLTLRK